MRKTQIESIAKRIGNLRSRPRGVANLAEARAAIRKKTKSFIMVERRVK